MSSFRVIHSTKFGQVRFCPELRDIEVQLGNVVVTMPLYRYLELRDLVYRASRANPEGTEVTLRSSSGQFQVVLGAGELRDTVALFQVVDVVFQAEGIENDREE